MFPEVIWSSKAVQAPIPAILRALSLTMLQTSPQRNMNYCCKLRSRFLNLSSTTKQRKIQEIKQRATVIKSITNKGKVFKTKRPKYKKHMYGNNFL